MSVCLRNNSFEAFQEVVKKSGSIIALTGAGASAESGVPTFRGAGGLWRTFEATSLATPEAFRSNPARVWEFYHYRRELVRQKSPNAGHLALAKFENIAESLGKRFTLFTQNVDGLHLQAGSKNVVEMHGDLFKTRCTRCHEVKENRDSPIVSALAGTELLSTDSNIPLEQLPRCTKCSSLLRPHIVWFGENLDQKDMNTIFAELERCDLLMVIGTSGIVYPAAGFASQVLANGGQVAEFNTELSDSLYQFAFSGPCGSTLPQALDIEI
ncbi:NAD-dependent deacetylase sirtuin-5-like protein [Basidiobolus meristosporus CBS 931.73]|uniref:NAD-dependent protein deacylase n=1 Tax=Basidiobolus meristosporus CBS 931.73 TaxID=1314790 RepID=A0A1Y1YKD0_9FUNG|nr:NAD-dependent deacetylase sirtuin-5-like protein [Basidiobolus meristosporus CBS 931.73]|eukprot:ORX98465.1 NAD-dependent deacetylase sirtuin-5-like protein [Basidiobolus meristosporus CBS 931.73]